jgi:hypothetical protein
MLAHDYLGGDMKGLRRFLGVLVMIAGVLGLVISIVGLVAIWAVKPTVAEYADSTITTLIASVDTSQQVMEITAEALGATVESVDALSTMLSTTATTVEDTQPVLNQFNLIMSDTLPSSLQAASDSLKTAQQAAGVLDSAIKSLDTFRFLMSSVPLVGGFIEQPAQAYNPEIPLADSLGDLAANLEGLPEMFVSMSEDMENATTNMVTIQTNLTTMSESVGQISVSLSEYEQMVSQSKSSMNNVVSILENIQLNLDSILNSVAIGLSVFFFWLLAAQVVILSQGWELYQGTTDRMEGEIEVAPEAA